jgi:hypothetical protein
MPSTDPVRGYVLGIQQLLDLLVSFRFLISTRALGEHTSWDSWANDAVNTRYL